MLQAINSNKAGRNISSEEIHWRQIFKASEDSLTSTIIGLLFYLPHELTWHILTSACYGNDLPTPTRVVSREFWPFWDGTGTSNSSRVEPDVFINTSNFDLIIEAKRKDNDQQNEGQWRNEFRAYLNEYGEDNKQVYLLALGGISTEQTQQLLLENRIMTVIMCRWERVLKCTRSALGAIRHSQALLNTSSSVINILEDILLGFSIHGYMTADWFSDTIFEGLQLGSRALDRWTDFVPDAVLPTFFDDLKDARINPNTLLNFDNLWNLTT